MNKLHHYQGYDFGPSVGESVFAPDGTTGKVLQIANDNEILVRNTETDEEQWYFIVDCSYAGN